MWWRMVEAVVAWRQWWKCCRRNRKYVVTIAYKECTACGQIYWRD